ncbi:hypothetical protein [Streptomyces sp. NPDC060194]|uniref:hypothetical protein n=1 Tax=Streptomyces sp. NPDC060194 TaxID=3347069 RepID=UPI0036552033
MVGKKVTERRQRLEMRQRYGSGTETAEKDGAGGGAEEQPARRQLDLSVPQVAGSALAAVAAAVLASTLGVYGTVIGAGVVSVVATCGGTVFQFLFKRTGEQIRDVTVQVKPKGRQMPARQVPVRRVPGDADVYAVPPTVAAPWPEDLRTQAIQRVPEGADPDATRALSVGPLPDDATRVLGAVRPPRPDGGRPYSGFVPDDGLTEEFTEATTHGTRVRGWRRSVLGAVLVFAVAMLGITAFELVSGRDLSGGKGTTVGNSFRGGHEGGRDPAPVTPEDPAASSSRSASPSPSSSSDGSADEGGTEPGSSAGPDAPGDRQPSAEPSTPDDDGAKPTPSPSTSPSDEGAAPSPEPSDGGGEPSGDGAQNDAGPSPDAG